VKILLDFLGRMTEFEVSLDDLVPVLVPSNAG
jgi:hypothetical protein